jgi:magnesium-transporting ATPase (P-type)
VLAARDGEIMGCMAVADRIKFGSAEAIGQMKRQGIKVLMITGDNQQTAEAIAEQVGIAVEDVVAGVLPEEKAKEVTAVQSRGLTVAFVGDGINDAPALAQADASIAMGTGTAIAMEAADMTLVKGNLSSLVTALELSRATMRVIRQNLFWACGYNVLLIPTAILSPFIPFLGEQMPVFAAGAMALSSVTVVSNALRLRFFASTQDKMQDRSPIVTWTRQWAPLLLSVALMTLILFAVAVGTLRYNTVRPAAHATSGSGTTHQFVAIKPTSDGQLLVTLAITPDQFGPNAFTVTVRDRQGGEVQVADITLSTTMLDMDMGTDSVALSADGTGHFRGTGSLSMTGDWQIRVLVHTANAGVHVATFTLTNH